MSTTTFMISVETGTGLIFFSIAFLFLLLFILNIFYPIGRNIDKEIRH